jgi:hypothetical protein
MTVLRVRINMGKWRDFSTESLPIEGVIPKSSETILYLDLSTEPPRSAYCVFSSGA